MRRGMWPWSWKIFHLLDSITKVIEYLIVLSHVLKCVCNNIPHDWTVWTFLSNVLAQPSTYSNGSRTSLSIGNRQGFLTIGIQVHCFTLHALTEDYNLQANHSIIIVVGFEDTNIHVRKTTPWAPAKLNLFIIVSKIGMLSYICVIFYGFGTTHDFFLISRSIKSSIIMIICEWFPCIKWFNIYLTSFKTSKYPMLNIWSRNLKRIFNKMFEGNLHCLHNI